MGAVSAVDKFQRRHPVLGFPLAVVYKPTASLIPDPRNARTHPKRQIEQIVASIKARRGLVEYVRFEDEGHGIIKLANKLVCYPTIAEFLDEHLGASSSEEQNA